MGTGFCGVLPAELGLAASCSSLKRLENARAGGWDCSTSQGQGKVRQPGVGGHGEWVATGGTWDTACGC